MATMFYDTDLLKEFCEIFAIDGLNIRAMQINIDLDDVVRITVTHLMSVEQKEKFLNVVKEYTLTVKKDGKDKNNI